MAVKSEGTFLSKLNYVVYTHTDCLDVWDVFFGQTKKFVPDEIKKTVFVNKKHDNLPDDYDVVLYDDKLTYTERVSMCISEIKEEYTLYHHEDMFLYSQPDWTKISSYIDYMVEENYDSVRLIKSGEMGGYSATDDLMQIPMYSHCNFVLQPTVIKTNRMVELFEKSKKTNIWDFEVDVQRVCKEVRLNSLYADTSDVKIGGHFESEVYPYVATGVVKGKWNVSEYPTVMDKIFADYNIDSSIRGVR